MLSDYFDFKNNVDREETFGSSRLIVEGKLATGEALLLSAILFLLSALIGLYFVLTVAHGEQLIWLIALGAFLGIFYTAGPITLKYRALGDLAVFIAFGPALATGAYFVQTGSYAWWPAICILPSAFLVDAILHSNNLRDLAHDAQVNINTIALCLGERGAQIMYFLLIGASYLSIMALVSFSRLSPWSLLTCLTIPIALRLCRKVQNKSKVTAQEFSTIDAETAQLHAAFSILFIVGQLIDLYVH